MTRYRTTASRALVLAMLLIVYTFNFLDRLVMAILATPIKTEFHLSDAQLGMLGGLAFAALYSILAIPFAWLADRTRRSWVISVSLLVWSGFTALCGLATGFGQLFLCRLGVGIGEAGGVAPSYALISDIFPASQRARALAVYSLGIPLGAGLGVLFGGAIAAAVDWRTAFLAVGLAGVIFMPIFALTVREPDHDAAARRRIAVGQVFGILAAKPAFWLLAFGAAASSMVGYGLAFWLPSLLQRSFGLTLLSASHFYGVLLLVGGIPGIMLGGWIADRAGLSGKTGYARIPGIAFLVAVPLFAAGMLSHNAALAFALFLIPQALSYMWLAPVLTAVQHLVPAPIRATASASFLLINNLIGLGLGALTIGKLSDMLKPAFGDEALRMGMLAALACYLVAGLLMLIAAPRLAQDWVE
jgi:predicted MFS family arabinose efflux permease